MSEMSWIIEVVIDKTKAELQNTMMVSSNKDFMSGYDTGIKEIFSILERIRDAN